MFIRRTTYRLNPGVEQETFERDLRANIRPQEFEGLISTAHVPNNDGSWTVVAVWETKVEAMAATAKIRTEWDRIADRLAAPPVVETAGVSFWEGA